MQEALTNVLKHATASHAAVHVGYRPDAIELQVLDDGHGPIGAGHDGAADQNPTQSISCGGHGVLL